MRPSSAWVGVLAVWLSCTSSTSSSRPSGGPSLPAWAVRHNTPAARADAGADASAPDATAAAPRARCPDDAVLIPGGQFTMGSPEGQGAPDEHPPHPVRLRPYCLDRTEARVDAYTRCVTAGACTRALGATPADQLPVTNVDWSQAEAFCRYQGGRLPTEAEWEFAARGTDARAYPWGADFVDDCAHADWTREGSSCNGVGPSPVGSFAAGASPFGVLDLAGNVWEWTADWYAPQYGDGNLEDPQGPATGSARVTRGGGWNNDQRDRLRSTFREGQHPAFRDYDLGVRCAYDPLS